MAEIIGVVASAVQITTCCGSILEFLRKIKVGSSTLRLYQQQLQELRGILESISRNPLLQTEEIATYTRSILTTIYDSDLQSLQRKRRIYRTWDYIWKDRDLVELFCVLEKKKTALLLCIEDVQAKTLHDICINLKAVKMTDMTPPSTPRISTETKTGGNGGLASLVAYGGSYHTSNEPLQDLVAHLEILKTKATSGMALFERNVVKHKGDMILGSAIFSDNGMRFAEKATDFITTPTAYVENIQEGVGDQVLGMYIETSELSTSNGTVQIPTTQAYYGGNVLDSKHDKGGKQILGAKIVLKDTVRGGK